MTTSCIPPVDARVGTEVEAAWQQGLDAVSAAMIDGQQAARRAAGAELL